ncbi:hypothetical protein [Diadegma fenestrale ichnovirus]|nr:hypothetical protein [Diadegma fenestrale ichnovirus]
MCTCAVYLRRPHSGFPPIRHCVAHSKSACGACWNAVGFLKTLTDCALNVSLARTKKISVHGAAIRNTRNYLVYRYS